MKHASQYVTTVGVGCNHVLNDKFRQQKRNTRRKRKSVLKEKLAVCLVAGENKKINNNIWWGAKFTSHLRVHKERILVSASAIFRVILSSSLSVLVISLQGSQCGRKCTQYVNKCIYYKKLCSCFVPEKPSGTTTVKNDCKTL